MGNNEKLEVQVGYWTRAWAYVLIGMVLWKRFCNGAILSHVHSGRRRFGICVC